MTFACKSKAVMEISTGFFWLIHETRHSTNIKRYRKNWAYFQRVFALNITLGWYCRPLKPNNVTLKYCHKKNPALAEKNTKLISPFPFIEDNFRWYCFAGNASSFEKVYCDVSLRPLKHFKQLSSISKFLSPIFGVMFYGNVIKVNVYLSCALLDPLTDIAMRVSTK